MAQNLTRRSLLKKGGLMAAAGAAAAIVGNTALAQEPAALTEEENYYTQAYQWSLNNDGIAIALSMSSDSQYDSDILAQHISSGIEQLNGSPVSTQSFTETRSDDGGNGVSFFIRGVGYGPFGIKEAGQNLSKVVSDLQAVRQASLIQDNTLA